MYLQYGTYSHSVGECVLTISKESILSQEGFKIGWRERWDIAGMIFGTDANDLTTKIRAMETAYGVNGRDLKLLNDDGTETAHKLISRQSRTGVIISNLGYPIGEGAEYTTFRNYTIAAECEFGLIEVPGGGGGGRRGPQGGNDPGVTLTFAEMITTRGTGGPRIVALETRDGDVVLQQVSKGTPVYTTQSGTATGYYGYPAVPAPINAGSELADRRVVVREAPTTLSQIGKQTTYRVSWSYEFVS
jgi:hypothetical protein